MLTNGHHTYKVPLIAPILTIIMITTLSNGQYLPKFSHLLKFSCPNLLPDYRWALLGPTILCKPLPIHVTLALTEGT